MIDADTTPLKAAANARFCTIDQSTGVPVIAFRVRVLRKDATAINRPARAKVLTRSTCVRLKLPTRPPTK